MIEKRSVVLMIIPLLIGGMILGPKTLSGINEDTEKNIGEISTIIKITEENNCKTWGKNPFTVQVPQFVNDTADFKKSPARHRPISDEKEKEVIDISLVSGDPGILWWYDLDAPSFGSAATDDIDGDGHLEIVFGTYFNDEHIYALNAENGTLLWWRNSGSDPIVWEEYVIVNDFNGAHRAEVCDLDFDGDIDIVGAAYHEGEISWWRNDGGNPISWTKHVVTAHFNGACIGLPIDIDADGDIDIVGTAQQANDVVVFRNDGSNPFEWTKIIIDTFFLGAWPGFVYDIDSDGDIDIVAGASFADKLAWWESDLNQKPLKPGKPTGPPSGKFGEEYIFSCITTDPYNLDLYYQFDWGDGNLSEWIGPCNSGEQGSASYTWHKKGNYDIRVKAKNTKGAESEWSDPLIVSMAKNKIININPLIIHFLENHPHLFSILRQILLFLK